MIQHYSGIVRNVDDPEKRGRLIVSIPEILSVDDDQYPDWIPPRASLGSGAGSTGGFFVPPVGSVIVVEFNGDQVRWMGGVYGPESALPSALSGEEYPNRSGWTSPDGSAISWLGRSTARVDAGESYVELGESATVFGGNVILGDGGESLVLGEAFLSDLRAYMQAVATFLVATSTATVAPQIALAATNALIPPSAFITMPANIAASVGPAKNPYLSRRSSTD